MLYIYIYIYVCRSHHLGDRIFRETCVPRNARFCGSGKATALWSFEALQTSSLHPRSHWGPYAASPDVRISLIIWSSEHRCGHG